MSTLRRPRTIAAMPAALLLALLAAGCSDDDASGGDPAPTGSTSSATSEPSEPTEPTEPTESTEPTDTTEPPSETAGATGPRLELESVSLRAPEGWTKQQSQSPFDVAARGGDGIQGNVVQIVTFPMIVGGSTLDEIAAASVKRYKGGKILEPVDVGGVTMAHVRGVSAGFVTDNYVAVVDGNQIGISFGYDNSVEDDRDFQQALMDEVLATVEWSG